MVTWLRVNTDSLEMNSACRLTFISEMHPCSPGRSLTAAEHLFLSHEPQYPLENLLLSWIPWRCILVMTNRNRVFSASDKDVQASKVPLVKLMYGRFLLEVMRRRSGVACQLLPFINRKLIPCMLKYFEIM